MESSLKYPELNKTRHGKQIDSIYENRLRQFIDSGGQYADINLPKFYTKARTDKMDITYYEVPEFNRPLFKDVIGKVDFDRVAHKGDRFGPSWKTFWFKIEFEIPTSWESAEEIWFQWDSASEALFYDEEGLPLQAFTGGERIDYILPKKFRKLNKTHIIYSEMACNGMFGVGMNSDISPPDPNRYFNLRTCDLIIPNLKARALYIDYLIITDAAREFPGDSWQKYKARQIGTEIIDAFDYNDENSIDKCLEIAKTYLGENMHDSTVYSENPLNKIDVYGIGNCHIDTAWLWPFAETRRKIVRSWTTQLNLIEKYPEYQFVASQAQQFKWLKQDHPEIFQLLQDQVKLNRFIPIGGSWVENDTNIPNGESLVRQFLFGQRFFQSNFNLRANTFWLPDTFGYSSQIPQLARLSGFTNFLTQKLSWNNINSFPNTSFNWIGIDGTQILTHMPPDDTYTADANFGDVKRSLTQHKNLNSDQTGLLCYGKGDGGGGPLPEMLEKLRRCRGLSNTVGLLPTVELQTSKNTVDEFFKNLLKNSNNGKKLPTWIGELYFEFHRGTYTSQALVKKLMRTNEIKLHDLEYFSTLASIYTDYKYPFKEINSIWEDVLLCQFHDVLPGSCIGMVYYEEVHPKLRECLNKSNKLIEIAISKLISSFNSNELILLNTLPWERDGVFKIPKKLIKSINQDDILIQNSTLKSSYIFAETINNALKPINSIKHPARIIVKKDEMILTNDRYLIKIVDGLIKSIYDLLNKVELIDQDSEGIQFITLKDTPLNWQAWDTELYSLDVITPLKSDLKPKINEEGPLRVSILFEQKISDNSTIQTILSLDSVNSLDSTSSIKFSCKVKWFESRKFLKIQIPTTINSMNASHETQFGYTSRPTHNNTTWDIAKFESIHHKYIDLSNFNYGISVLNDCKYGGGVHGNIITLSLLRGPREPDADADKGEHKFKFGIIGHSKSLGFETVKAGFEFNNSIWSVVNKSKSDKGDDFNEFIKVSSKGNNLILSNIKRSEDDFGEKLSKKIGAAGDSEEFSVIVRIYESLGGYGEGKLTITPPKSVKLTNVYKVNLLEDELEELEGPEIELKTREFEVVSYKLVFEK